MGQCVKQPFGVVVDVPAAVVGWVQQDFHSTQELDGFGNRRSCSMIAAQALL
jgi:hypothetical protein